MAFIQAVDMSLPLKALKRRFNMTKKEVEYNIKVLPWHRAKVEASGRIAYIRSLTTITNMEKLRQIHEINKSLDELWERVK